MNLSSTEENYLKAIFKLAETSGNPISTNAISNRINTSAASVTDMLKKLSEKNLLLYEKYKGVQLTETGEGIAKGLVRNHRLWEVFLVNILKFNWDEVHDIAEELEHIKSDLLINRLEEFLDYPKFDPHGDPIPDRKGIMIYPEEVNLSELGEGEGGVIIGVKDTSTGFLQYLDSIKIGLGTTINVKTKVGYDGSLIIKIDNKREWTLSLQVSKNLLVKVDKK